jgi:hypothetical protein
MMEIFWALVQELVLALSPSASLSLTHNPLLSLCALSPCSRVEVLEGLPGKVTIHPHDKTRSTCLRSQIHPDRPPMKRLTGRSARLRVRAKVFEPFLITIFFFFFCVTIKPRDERLKRSGLGTPVDRTPRVGGFRAEPVFKAYRLMCHSTLGSRVIKNKQVGGGRSMRSLACSPPIAECGAVPRRARI